jgi:hypothetical protein
VTPAPPSHASLEVYELDSLTPERRLGHTVRDATLLILGLANLEAATRHATPEERPRFPESDGLLVEMRRRVPELIGRLDEMRRLGRGLPYFFAPPGPGQVPPTRLTFYDAARAWGIRALREWVDPATPDTTLRAAVSLPLDLLADSNDRLRDPSADFKRVMNNPFATCSWSFDVQPAGDGKGGTAQQMTR